MTFSKRRYFGVAEQVLLSASNMLASVVVVKKAGVSWFGIYSFIFVISTLVTAFFSTWLHRQMMLLISSKPCRYQYRIFYVSVFLQSLMLLVFLLLVGLPAFYLYLQHELKYIAELYLACLFIVATCFFELFRQYLYVVDHQFYSLRCTLVYVLTLLAGVVWLVLSSEISNVVAFMYLIISVAMFVSLLLNKKCHDAIHATKWLGWRYVFLVFMRLYRHSRFRVIGMLLTWAQNQSINPLLMWLGGPLIAGYYSIGRLLVMPMAVVNHGLTNSSAPEFRRIYETKSISNLYSAISKIRNLSFKIAGLYVLLLVLAHAFGVFQRYIPEYQEVKWYLLIWAVMVIVMMYRQWVTQYFIVGLQFRFLMNVSVIAVLVSMSGLIGLSYFLENIYGALWFIVLGEAVSIFIMNKKLPKKVAL